MTLIKHLKAVLKITNDEWDAADDAEDWERSDRLEGEVEAYERCIKLLTDATTPRPPQPEWFGTGPGQWDAWMDESGRVYRNGRWSILPACDCCVPTPTPFFNDMPVCDPVIPVAREGYPAPAGWQVLEVKP